MPRRRMPHAWAQASFVSLRAFDGNRSTILRTRWPRKHSIRLAKPSLNLPLVTQLTKQMVPFSVDKEGTVWYSKQFDELVDVKILPPLRSHLFPRWQVLSFPPEWAGVYRNYMQRRRVRFESEWINGQLVFLLPASYRPHTWNLPDPAGPDVKRAVAHALTSSGRSRPW